MTTGERIRYARKAKNMTIVELADKIGVKHPTVSRYEHDSIDMTLSMLLKISHVLDVPPIWLMGYDDDKTLVVINGKLSDDDMKTVQAIAERLSEKSDK